MKTYIVLLRGVNVGGKNLLPMKPFVSLLEQNDFQKVKYYIQSGNIVLESKSDPNKKIQDIIYQQYNFMPDIFTLTVSDFASVVNNNPYKEQEGKLVHFYFCENAIALNLEKMNHWISSTEKYQVINNVFYLFAPEGIGRSKLVANIGACLQQSGTGRNLNTINKIKQLSC